MRISLDTTEPLTRAMRLYEKNGFCRSGRVSDFFGMKLFEYVNVLRVKETTGAEAQPGRGSNAKSDPGKLLARSDSGASKATDG
jgi:hypothetical protein